MSDVLKKGSKGEKVRQLQTKMTQLGYDIDVDGDFGPATEHAVKELQRAFGYTVDGIVGDGTTFLITQQTTLGWKSNAPAPAPQATHLPPGKTPAKPG